MQVFTWLLNSTRDICEKTRGQQPELPENESDQLMHGWIQRGDRVSGLPGKSQVAICPICFLRNTGTDPLGKQLDPFPREVCMAQTVIYVDDQIELLNSAEHEIYPAHRC